MPLVKATLTAALTELFEDPPDTESACADAWGEVLGDYFATIVPASSTVAAAAAELPAALAGMSDEDAALGTFVSALATFGGTVASGMTPPGTPPTSAAPFLTPVWETTYETDVAAAEAVAGAIDSWARTGLSGANPFPPWS